MLIENFINFNKKQYLVEKNQEILSIPPLKQSIREYLYQIHRNDIKNLEGFLKRNLNH